MTANEKKIYLEEELVALVQSLDRPQDKGLFSKDVLLVYPHLAEEYTRVCPKRFDLATAAQRAADGVYSYDVKLTALREDIELMVNNCYSFNGIKGPIAATASSFHKFAQQQIDAYLTSKAGGRRLSSLRLATAGDEVIRGKRGREDTQQQKQQAIVAKCKTTDVNISGVSSADIVKLVDSLDRREDKGAFAVDVVKAYPELKENYEKVCPVKMNLIIVRERATSGYYFGAPKQEQSTVLKSKRRSLSEEIKLSTVFADTVAGSLALLRDDVELMVSNCIRFNSGVQEWIQLAESFQVYAHKKIDDFVLLHAPYLKGTLLGVEKYISRRQEQQQQQHQETSDQATLRLKQTDVRLNNSNNNNNKSFSAQDGEQGVVKAAAFTALPASSGGKKETARRTPAAAEVKVVNYVTPTVDPTALQPVFATPTSLRNRLISDHLHRETLRARFINTSYEDCKEGNCVNADTNCDNQICNNDFPCMFDRALSCRAVLCAFAVSVRNFYKQQRERQDFENPFEYQKQAEQLYIDYITLIEQQFERLFFHMLLYEQEKVDVYDWSSVKAARRAIAGSGGSSLLKNNKNDYCFFGCCWLDEMHLCYLVRFLQHFPQLMGLACATTITNANTTGGKKGKPVLHITQVAKGVIEKLAKITEELLTFIAAYEQKVVNAENEVEL